MVEQCPFKAMVEGSSPSGVTILEIARNVGVASAAPTSDLISFSVTPVGFEPTIFGMKARRPGPLDDGAKLSLAS